jgi:ribosomal protein S18 acetylase RimI-like enzyme
MSSTHSTRVAVDADIDWIIHLARSESNAIGFLPACAIGAYVADGRCLIHHLDDEPAGYICFRETSRQLPGFATIMQLAVVSWRRRRRVGTRLVEAAMLACAFNHHSVLLQAWTRDDITAAAALWKFLGFTAVAKRRGLTARRKETTLWRFPLTTAVDLHANLPRNGGFRAARLNITPMNGRP